MSEKNIEWKIEKIIASDLNRTIQTANIINKKLNLPVEYTEKLREMNNGKIAGMLNSEVEERYPGLYYNTLAMDEKYPDGESPIEFYERIKTNFKKIIEENKELKNIMLVTHSGVINIIYYIVKNMEWSNKIKSFPIGNTSIHRLVIEDDNMYFDIENLKDHLE